MSLKAFFKPVLVSEDLESEQTKKKLKLDSSLDGGMASAVAHGRDESLELSPDEIAVMDPSWKKVLCMELKKDYFKKLKVFLEQEQEANKVVFPPRHLIFSWSTMTPFSSVKVVILGQDPYHNQGQAMGLAFSVPRSVPPPPSLVNIYKELKRSMPDFVIPTHGCLESWAKQGVLLLNASLTVRAHEAGSHFGKGWEEFTDAAIKAVNMLKSHVVFLLWGSFAQKKGKGIDTKKHLVLTAPHPSPLSAHKGFIGCDHFIKVNDYLSQHHITPINWSLI